MAIAGSGPIRLCCATKKIQKSSTILKAENATPTPFRSPRKHFQEKLYQGKCWDGHPAKRSFPCLPASGYLYFSRNRRRQGKYAISLRRRDAHGVEERTGCWTRIGWRKAIRFSDLGSFDVSEDNHFAGLLEPTRTGFSANKLLQFKDPPHRDNLSRAIRTRHQCRVGIRTIARCFYTVEGRDDQAVASAFYRHVPRLDRS